MSRTVQVYPKAYIEATTWHVVFKVDENGQGSSHFLHTFPAGVSNDAEDTMLLHKIVFTLIVADTDTDQDVDDALFVDDIKPGPQIKTVWGNWQGTAEGIIAGLDPGYTDADFAAGWTKPDTAKMRNDAHRALVIQRGWTVTAVHQHEGDHTVTDE